jgi:hypothetical protein
MVVKRTRFQFCWRLADGKPAGYLKPRFLLAVILLVITMSTIAEADCWEDSLKQVDRDILVMGSEAVYQVVPEDEMTSVFWLPPAHILFAIRSLTWVASRCSIISFAIGTVP